MMKKIMMATAAIATVGLFATGASAETDKLKLSGKVDYQCDVALGAQSGESLSLADGGWQRVAFININCNDGDGFELSVDSMNDGILLGTDGETQVEYDARIENESNCELADLSLPNGDGSSGPQPKSPFAAADLYQCKLMVNLNSPAGDNDSNNPLYADVDYKDEIILTLTGQ